MSARFVFSLLPLALFSACVADPSGEPLTSGGGATPAAESRAIAMTTPRGTRLLTLDVVEEAPKAAEAEASTLQLAPRPLEAKVAQRLLDRVRAPDAPDAEPAFRLPPAGPPPPEVGETAAAPFPPAPTEPGALEPPVEDQRPLAVERITPRGDVAFARDVQVQFSHPMVALSAPAELDGAVKVRLEPEPPGKWRWVDPALIVFEPEDGRLPAATAYTVRVPEGLIASDGRTLAEGVQADFQTPAPRVVSVFPFKGTTGVSTRPVMVLSFDQKVDAAQVISLLTLSGAPVRAATEGELELDDGARAALRAAGEGRGVAVVPAEALATETEQKLELAAGKWSAEGPLPAEAPFRSRFTTYGPFRVARHECGWGDECRPGAPFRIEMTNPLAPEAEQPKPLGSVSPEGPTLEWTSQGLTARGQTEAMTEYTVTLSPDLRDRFGQRLGQTEPLTFSVKGAHPFLTGPGGVVVRRLKAEPSIPVWSAGAEALDLRLARLGPGQWGAWNQALREREAPLVGTQVAKRKVSATQPPEAISETPIALGEALESDGSGLVAVRLTAPVGHKGREQTLNFVAVVSDVLLDAWAAPDLLYVVATDPAGAPRADLEVRLQPNGARARTDAQGLAKIALPEKPLGEYPWIETDGGGFLPDGAWSRGRGFAQTPAPRPRVSFLSLDDRGLYRPGETAHVKGWARIFDPEEGLLALPADTQLRYEVMGPRGNAWGKGELSSGTHGSFDLAIDVPEDANLGHAHIRFTLTAAGLSGSHVHALRVESFRRPVFEVGLEVDEGPHVVGRALGATASATAYAGGPIAQAPARWSIETSEASYAPPGLDGYRFGRSFPWWWRHGPIGGRGMMAPSFGGLEALEGPLGHETTTDAAGSTRLRLEPKAALKPFPVHLDLRVEVEDVDRRTVASSAGALVHSSTVYVGVKPSRIFMAEDEPLELEVVLADIEGQLVSGTAELALIANPGFGPLADDTEEEEVAQRSCTLDGKAQTVSFPAVPGGRYLLRAEVEDARGRRNRTETTVYWAGAPARSVERAETETLELAPDAERYVPGDTAKVTVRSPIASAQGWWMVLADGVQAFEPLTVTKGFATIEIPITARLAPGFALEAWVAGGSEGRPRSAAHRMGLEVFPAADALEVEVRPEAEATAPGSATSVTVVVRDADGAPVPGAEVTLAVVDEAVLAVSGSEWPERPLESLLLGRNTSLRAWHARDELLLARPEPTEVSEPAGILGNLSTGTGGGGAVQRMAKSRGMALAAPAPMMEADMADAGGSGGLEPEGIELRAELRPLAHFEPSAKTDAEGRVTVQFTLPDDLTRYRARAIAATPGARFGRGEASFLARKPVSIEPALPRFLSFGDHPELPYILVNRTSASVEATIAVGGAGLGLEGALGYSATLPAHSRSELRFPAEIARVGEVSLRAVVAAGSETDAVQNTLPVYAPATEESFAEHGSIEGGFIARKLALPKDLEPRVGALELELSSSRVLAAKDAFRQVLDYPYLCAEQRASRLIASRAFRTLAPMFEGTRSPAQLDALAESDVKVLVEQQRADGGWGWWSRARRSDAFLTAHVLHALVRAQNAGTEVPSGTLDRAVRWLDALPEGLPDHIDSQTSATLQAYARWTLALLGKGRASHLEAVLETGGGLAKAPTEALAWLHGAAARLGAQKLEAQLRRALDNRVSSTARTAHLVSTSEPSGHLTLSSEARADALYLLTLLDSKPKDGLVEKLLAGLMAGRRALGGWAHTQENAWALLAVAAYAEVYEKTPPSFTAEAWLDEARVLEEKFSGREDAARTLEIPMAWLAEHPDARRLVLGKKGGGRMYYRVGLETVPASLQAEASARGFTVHRRYEAVDDPDDVEKTEDGWRIRAGARVRIRLELVAPGPRHHVALVDRLPAGLEPLHPGLDQLGPLPAGDADDEPRGTYFRWWTWDHENLRDTGAEAFAVDLDPGLHRYTYVARATTPGAYVSAPARAEEMYAPETYGRTSSEEVVIFLADRE